MQGKERQVRGQMREIAPENRRLQLISLLYVEPLLRPYSEVVYEYTVPLLGQRTLDALRAASTATPRVYKRPKKTSGAVLTPEERYLPPYEAARLISSVYARCLEALRFAGASPSTPDRDEIFDSFVRALLSERVLPAVEMVAENIYTLRELDNYGPEIGTNVVRWMEYLAFEALESNLLRSADEGDGGVRRLQSALRTIRDATYVLDRYRALLRA